MIAAAQPGIHTNKYIRPPHTCMKEQYVKDLQPDQTISDYYAVSSKSSLKQYKGKQGTWFSFDMSDRTGTITAKFWGGQDEDATKKMHSSFYDGDVVSIKNGRTQIYRDALEVHLTESTCEVLRSDSYDTAELVPRSGRDIPEMISQLYSEIDAIANPDIKRLLKSVFDDDLVRQYSETPAAKSYHHNYVGGLLEHVLSMVALGKTVAKQYEPELDQDLLVAGCMLHDLGKIFTYETTTTIGYTVPGTLLGHIPMGAKLVEDKIDGLEDFPAELKNKILHLILSHHGSLDAGSPVPPMFAEAVALHKIDDCDAKIKNAIQERTELRQTGQELVRQWSRNIYLK